MDWIHIEPDIQPYTEQEKIALDILNQGKHYFCISSRLHISFEKARDLVFSIRKKESIIMGKLNDAQRAEIYQAWKDGATPKELGKQYGVSDQSIYNLINKRTKADDKTEPKMQINKEFDDAVNAMIAESKSSDAEKKSAIAEPEQLEDCENGIPNTPLVPLVQQGNDKLPGVVKRALDGHLAALQEAIEEREQKIDDLKYEIDEFREDIERLKAWKEQHT